MFKPWLKSIWLFVIAACMLISCTPPSAPPTPAPPPVAVIPTQPATTRPVNLNPTRAPQPAATATPQGSLIKLEWKIDSGDISYLGAAKDGTLYGLTKPDSRTGLKYVVISPKGEVVKLADLPEARACAQSYTADYLNRQAYTVLSDGTLLCHKPDGNTLLRITPDGKASLTHPWNGYEFITGANTFFVNDNGTLKFYDANGKLLNQVQLPQNWSSSQRQYYADGKDLIYLTHDGQSVKIPIPDGLDLNDKLVGEVLPWDDFYLTYRAYDAIGNFKGEKTLYVTPDGKVTILDKNPWAERYQQSLVPLAYVFYSPDRTEIYAIDDVGYWHKLALINRDNQTLQVYEFPQEVDLSKAFVGNDGAVYVWSSTLQGKPQLSKYTLGN